MPDMIKGFILLRLLPGLEADALTQIRTIPGVADLTLVFGSWDAVVQAEAKTLTGLTRLVVGQIRGIRGVQASETLVATEL
jgi:DNA-binding Lrp family transcriptional regulator